MIDFACKRFVLDDIVKCSFGLSRAELLVFKHLMGGSSGWLSTVDLSRALGLDLSTVQRAVKKLHGADVVLRDQENLGGGGYVFRYRAVEHSFFKEKVMGILSSWLGKVDASLDSWP
ncbi:MarR family transcriptional regulator [Candidatus Woesearchaeota archaeon]|nr:MarR family transcriptional regulator [Candidatus Woesearchaeota archaeon]